MKSLALDRRGEGEGEKNREMSIASPYLLSLYLLRWGNKRLKEANRIQDEKGLREQEIWVPGFDRMSYEYRIAISLRSSR